MAIKFFLKFDSYGRILEIRSPFEKTVKDKSDFTLI